MSRPTSSADEAFMKRALRLAASGQGSTYPNPCVGAVVVKGGRVVGAGRSRATGGPHAEVVALRKAKGAARGATLYVTLEPCCHRGRTPPCTRTILEAGITRVVVAIRDPAAHVNGRGIRVLRKAGVRVDEGIGAAQGSSVHGHYLHHVETGRPYVTLKAAVSLDGQMATKSGDSRWITGKPARVDAHRLRASHHAIAVGVGTVLADDPALTVRHVRGVDPVRVVFDSRLRLARALGKRQILAPGTILLHTRAASSVRQKRLVEAGLEAVLVRTDRHGHVDVKAALRALGKRDIRSLMVEGGPRLLSSFYRARAWQQFLLYQAPKLLGQGRALLEGFSAQEVAAAPAVRVQSRRRVGVDERILLRPG